MIFYEKFCQLTRLPFFKIVIKILKKYFAVSLYAYILVFVFCLQNLLCNNERALKFFVTSRVAFHSFNFCIAQAQASLVILLVSF